MINLNVKYTTNLASIAFIHNTMKFILDSGCFKLFVYMWLSKKVFFNLVVGTLPHIKKKAFESLCSRLF